MAILTGLLFTVFITVVIIRIYLKTTWIAFKEKADMTGKTVIVTGANGGVGEALALELAKRNARVILACRSLIRGEASRMYITSMAQRKNSDIVLKQLDLSSLSSVRMFAKNIFETEPRLDVLVNNAATTGLPITTTKDGMELTYQVNHFGPFLLTHLLLDLLKTSGPGSRIVNVGSLSHIMASNLECISPDELRTEKRSFFKKPERFLYHDTKLMNLMFTMELSNRLTNSGVTVNCVHPGLVRTNLLQNKGLLMTISYVLTSVLSKSPEEGCQPILHCVTSRDLENVSGKYFGNGEEDRNISKMVFDEKLRKRLWEISERLTGL